MAFQIHLIVILTLTKMIFINLLNLKRKKKFMNMIEVIAFIKMRMIKIIVYLLVKIVIQQVYMIVHVYIMKIVHFIKKIIIIQTNVVVVQMVIVKCQLMWHYQDIKNIQKQVNQYAIIVKKLKNVMEQNVICVVMIKKQINTQT